jgi:hypothetical protein
MRDPGRYERSMGLYVVLMLVLGIESPSPLRDRRLWRPVAAASVAFGILFGGSGRLAHAPSPGPVVQRGTMSAFHRAGPDRIPASQPVSRHATTTSIVNVHMSWSQGPTTADLKPISP